MKIDEIDAEDSRAIISSLTAAVYPPDVMKSIVWRNVTSARASRRVVIYDSETLVSAAGVLFRLGGFDGAPVRIGGIGGVMTLPSAQRRGFGRATMLATHEIIERTPPCDFGLLFCEPENFDFYSGLGWSAFEGTVIAEQPGSTGPYNIMQPMVRKAAKAAPTKGIIDLCGLPW